MIVKKIILILTLFCFPLLAQQQNPSSSFENMLSTLIQHSVKEISPTEIKKKKEVILLDAREKKEFKISHIKNAIWIGYNNFKNKRVKEIDKNKTVVVYCSVGYRSEKIAERLVKLGFTDVYNLYGGIFKWVNQGNSVYNSKEETLQVHTFNKDWSQWLTNGEKIY